MSWYAFDAVDDALAATRRFLLPVSLGRWLRLMVVVFFLGGGTGLNPSSFTNVPSSSPTDPAPGPGGTPFPGLPELPALPDLALLIAVAGVVLLVAVLFGIASATMRFVLFDALRTDEVSLRRWFRTRLGGGVRLFVFQLIVGLVTFSPLLAVAGLFVIGQGSLPIVGLPLIVGFVGLQLLLFIVGGLVSSFTAQFVVPTMIAEDRGLLSAWGRFGSVLRAHLWQFLLYLLVRWVITLGIGIATAIVGLVLGGIVVVAGGALGLGVVVAFGGLNAVFASTAGVVAVAAVAAVTLLLLLIVTLSIGVPVQSFLASYELSVLGRADPALALLPETGDDDGGSVDDGGNDDDGDGPRDVGGGSPAVTRRDDAGSDETGESDRRGDGNEVAGGGNEFVWPDEDEEDGRNGGRGG